MSAEWLALLLRLLIIVGIYIFLFQVVLVIRRDLVGARSATAAPPAAPIARLVVVDAAGSGLLPGQVVPLTRMNTIGRAAANTIPIDDEFVSVRHASLGYRDRRWWLEDLGSTNGTFLNGRPVRGVVQVRSGEQIGIGRVRLRFEVGG